MGTTILLAILAGYLGYSTIMILAIILAFIQCAAITAQFLNKSNKGVI